MSIKLIIYGLFFTITISLTANEVAAKQHHMAKESAIKWNSWSEESFNRARQENKMILLSVGIEVCFACQWMEDFTYSDPEVIKLVKEHFLPIQVDADNQPDIGERYSDWAWPATIFMSPDGTQVLGLRGNRIAINFIPILNHLIQQQANGQLKPDELARLATPPEPASTDLTEIRNHIRTQLDVDYDDIEGGWSDELKEIEGSGNIIQLFHRAQSEGDQQAKKRALQTAYAMLQRIDNVWGGFYSAGTDGWTSPISEKRTGAQATAIEVFAYAYHQTGDARFLAAAKEVNRYLMDWMLSPEGTFYTSQKDLPPNLPKGWTTKQYLSLKTDIQRRAFGIPKIDHAIYTDLNARLIVAYTSLFEATGDLSYLDIAIKCAKYLLEERQQKDGWILHVSDSIGLRQDERIHIKSTLAIPYLRDQANFGVALLALHRVTGETYWIKSAERLSTALIQHLEDREFGGFYASGTDGSALTSSKHKPLLDNGIAARFLYQLGKYTKNSDLITSSERAIRAVGSQQHLDKEGRIIGELAVAAEIVTSDYVEFTVVGSPYHIQAKQLFEAGRQFYEPRKLLHYEQPGRYPDLGRPVMFICSHDACSVPIFEPKDIAKQANKFNKRI